MLRFDHIIFATGDAVNTARRLREQYGLGSVPGPTMHSGMDSIVVPLRPPQFLQFVFAGQRDMASRHVWGVWMQLMGRQPEVPIGWGLETDQLDAIAKRLGIEALDLEGWRAVADPQSIGSLPYFVQYTEAENKRIETWKQRFELAHHTNEPGEIAWVEIGAEEDRLDQWLGGEQLDVRRRPGTRAVQGVGIRMANGSEITIGAATAQLAR